MAYPSETERRRLERFPEQIAVEDLRACFALSDADRALVFAQRGAPNRLARAARQPCRQRRRRAADDRAAAPVLGGVGAQLAAVRAGGDSLTPQLALAASGRHVAALPAADARSLIAKLTDAERVVLALLANGRVPKQAAHDLSIALPTVRSRIAAAKRKTGARTLEQLVALYATADVA